MKKLFLSAFFSVMLLGAGCASTQQARSIQSSGVVDPAQVKVGDEVSGLKVTKVSGVPGIQLPYSYGDIQNIHIEFSGPVTVKGDYDYSTNEFFGQDLTTFRVSDPQEILKLPHLKQQEPVVFWFSNPDKANKAFGPAYGNGSATILIEDYEINYAGAEVMNSAKLVKVISK